MESWPNTGTSSRTKRQRSNQKAVCRCLAPHSLNQTINPLPRCLAAVKGAQMRLSDLAEVVDDGATIINFGSLESNTGTNIFSLAPNNVALKSIHVGSWFRLG